MSTIYYMPRTDIVVPVKPPSRLECIIIRNYPTKYSKAFKALKEFLDGTPHITQYCKIKYGKYVRSSEWRKWNICNVKPENIYVFPYYIEYLRFIGLLDGIRRHNSTLLDYIVYPTFYLRSDNIYPLEYYSCFGNLLIDECNLEYISE